MKILSFDIGIKTLAYSIIDTDNITSFKCSRINVTNPICDVCHLFPSFVEKNVKEKREFNFTNLCANCYIKENEEREEKKEKKITFKKIKNHSQSIEGGNRKRSTLMFFTLFCKNVLPSIISDVDMIVIEKQINITFMSKIEDILVCFLLFFDFPQGNINIWNSSNKLNKTYENILTFYSKITHGNTYKNRKEESVLIFRKIVDIIDVTLNPLFFVPDISDSFLQCLSYCFLNEIEIKKGEINFKDFVIL